MQSLFTFLPSFEEKVRSSMFCSEQQPKKIFIYNYDILETRKREKCLKTLLYLKEIYIFSQLRNKNVLITIIQEPGWLPRWRAHFW